MISCVYEPTDNGEKCVIVAADVSVERTFDENFVNLRRHLASVAHVVRGLKLPTYVFMPESNLGNEGQHLAEHLQFNHRSGRDQRPLPGGAQVPTSFCVRAEDDGRAGVRMTHALKEQLVAGLEFRLRQRLVCFHQNFVTTSKGHTPDTMRNLVVQQLCDFASYLKYPASGDEHALPKRIFSGQEAGQDDLTIGVLLNPLMRRLFLTNAKNGAYH